MSEQPWHAGYPPVTVSLDCGGATHRIRWDDGRLALLDHDRAAEAAVGALGGATPRCLEVLDAWREEHEQLAGGLAWLAREPEHVDSRLPGELAVLVRLARMAGIARRWDEPDADPPLRNWLARRMSRSLEAAFRDALRASAHRRGRLKVSIGCGALAPGEQVTVEAEVRPAQVRLQLGMPVTWLVDVWGRGVARVHDLVVLDVVERERGPDRLGVLAVGWEAAGRGVVAPRLAPVWLERLPEGWVAADDEPPPPVRRHPWWSVRTAPMR